MKYLDAQIGQKLQTERAEYFITLLGLSKNADHALNSGLVMITNS